MLIEWKYVIEAVENNTYTIKTIIPPIDDWPIHVYVFDRENVETKLSQSIFSNEEWVWAISFFNKKTGKLQWKGEPEYYYLGGKIEVRFNGFCYKNDEPTTKSIYPNKCD